MQTTAHLVVNIGTVFSIFFKLPELYNTNMWLEGYNEYWTGKILENWGCDLFDDTVSWHSLGVTEDRHKEHHSGIWLGFNPYTSVCLAYYCCSSLISAISLLHSFWVSSMTSQTPLCWENRRAYEPVISNWLKSAAAILLTVAWC